MEPLNPMSGNDAPTERGLGIRAHSFIGVLTILSGVFFGTNGYLVGYYEQSLLSIHGIALADRTAFVGDWFNLNAPQPHIFFDVVTYFGEKLQLLDGVYFAYYLVSCTMFVLGTALLARHWLPLRLQWMQHFVTILATVGPSFSLGTFLTIHMEAVPNMAGACAAYLGIAMLITRRWTWLAVMLPVTSVLHLQHGLGLASIVILATILRFTEKRLVLLASSMLTIAIAVMTVVERDLLGGSKEIANDVAEVGSTGHFNAQLWGSRVIWSGIFLIVLALLNFALDSRSAPGRRLFGVFMIASLAPIVGVVSDLWNIEPFQSLARSFFVYRYSMYLVPFAYWLIVRLFARSTMDRSYLAVPELLLSLFLLWRVTHLIYSWSATYFHLGELFVIGLLVVTARIVGRKPTFLARGLIVLVAVAASIAMFNSASDIYGRDWPHLGLSRNDPNVLRTGEAAQHLGPKDVLATDPSIGWMRLFLRRAIVADCHGTPYGGDAWWEYRRRLRALGVEKPNQCTGFRDLSYDRILALRESVGATTILLDPGAASYGDAVANLKVRWKAEDGSDWTIFELPTGAGT